MRPQVATLSVAGVHQIGPTDFGEIIYALREKSGVVPSSPRSLRPANLLCLITFFSISPPHARCPISCIYDREGPPTIAGRLREQMHDEKGLPLAPLAVTVDQACDLVGVRRTKLYELVRTGQLRLVKIGRRSVIPFDDLKKLVSPTNASAPA